MNITLKNKALSLLAGVLTTISTTAQSPALKMLSKDPIKYALGHADFGASSTNFVGKKFTVFAEDIERMYLSTPIIGARYNAKDFSTKVGYSKDYFDENSYGFLSAGYAPKLTKTMNRRSTQGLYADFKSTVTKLIGKNKISNNNVALDQYVGLKYLPNNRNRISFASGVRFNNLIPGGKEFKTEFTSTKPFIPPRYSRKPPQKYLYFKFGTTSSKLAPINYNIGVGVHL